MKIINLAFDDAVQFLRQKFAVSEKEAVSVFKVFKFIHFKRMETAHPIPSSEAASKLNLDPFWVNDKAFATYVTPPPNSTSEQIWISFDDFEVWKRVLVRGP